MTKKDLDFVPQGKNIKVFSDTVYIYEDPDSGEVFIADDLKDLSDKTLVGVYKLEKVGKFTIKSSLEFHDGTSQEIENDI